MDIENKSMGSASSRKSDIDMLKHHHSQKTQSENNEDDQNDNDETCPLRNSDLDQSEKHEPYIEEEDDEEVPDIIKPRSVQDKISEKDNIIEAFKDIIMEDNDD